MGQRTRTFADIFPDWDTFNAYRTTCGFPDMLQDNADYSNYSPQVVYYLLLSEYANSSIKSSDEGRFKLKLMSILYQYGPTWQREMYLQEKLLRVSDDEMLVGSRAVYNHAKNPGVEPSTSALDQLEYIDDQNVTNYMKNKPDAYREISDGLSPSITKRFLDKFKQLFVPIAYGDYPLIYIEED